MMRLKRSIILGLLLSVPGLLVAQNQLTATGPIPFTAFDRDSNGLISPQEFVSTHAKRRALQVQSCYSFGKVGIPLFRSFDSNDDGQLSEKELLAGRYNNRLLKRVGPGGGRMGMGGRNMPSFNDFDLNNDGVLKKDEFEQARARRISERASQGYLMRNLANAPSFALIDRDSDGEVTPSEFIAAQAAHRQQRFF